MRFKPHRVAAVAVSFVISSSGALDAQVQFVNEAGAAGVAGLGFGRGAAMVDFDGDGLLDLFAANTGPNVVYRQLDDGTFEDMTTAWAIPIDDDPTWTVLASDFDNDGDPDLMLLIGGFIDFEVEAMAFGGAGFGLDGLPNKMLRNDLDSLGVFTDVTAESGAVGGLITGVFGGVAADYDRDGDLDVFLSNQPVEQTCHLLRNDGDLFFTDVSVEAEITHPGNLRHVGSGDIDNDGWIDFAAANQSGPNLVYRNNGDGTFIELAAASGLASPGENFGAVFADFDNDGWLDAYLPKYDRFGEEPSPALYLNNGDGTFRDVTDGSGMGVQTDMGHTVADVDDDGHPDILAGTGGPLFLEADRLYLVTPDGLGGLTADDVSVASGIQAEGGTRQHGQAMGDVDGDGDLDYYANNGGPFFLKETEQENFLWLNQGTGRHWVGFDLEGRVSNRDGIGTRVMIETTGGRQIHAWRDGGRGFGNTDAPTLRLGVDAETDLFFARLDWPSGIEQIVLHPTADARHPVTETGILGPDTAPVGTGYSFTVYGPPDQEVDTVLSSALAPEPVLIEDRGGFGRLAPPLTFGPSVTIDASGSATIVLDIPDVPDLVGETVYVQSWVHDPGATDGGMLSNLLTFEIVE